MRELSLNIMDIVQNSISAGAKNINIFIFEDLVNDMMMVTIRDDGRGMEEEFVDKVKDPFVTTRIYRKVGLGISMLEAECKRCDGDLKITSQFGKGTEIRAIFRYNHIDRPPIGRILDTVVTLLAFHEIDIRYRHKVDEKEFLFEGKEIKEIVKNIFTKEVLDWVKEYLTEGLKGIGANLWG